MRAIDQLSFFDKLRIVEEYRSNEDSLHELARKYGVSHTSIWRWNRIFAPVKRSSRMNTNKDLKSQENDVRIREPEAELERLRLLVEAKDIMLDIVKEQTGFDARKKDGAKQAFYQHHRKADDTDAYKERILLYIKEIREKFPGCGVRKIHEMLRRYYQTYHIGRNHLFDLLREEGMLIRKRKRKKRTTYSDHHMCVYPDVIVDVIPARPNEIWVSDITYLQYLDKDYYLFLVTDAYSHKTVGRTLSDNMKVDNAIQALRMALRQRKDKRIVITLLRTRKLQFWLPVVNFI